MKTFVPSKPAVYKGYRRMTRIVGGEELVSDTADMLTEPLPAFEQRCAAIYPDWPAFVAWVDKRRHDVFAIALTFLAFVILWPAAANAQYDPCEVCQAEHGVAVCPCLPVQAEPEPVGGTIPPVTAIACIPDGPQPDISGCDDKVWLPMIAVTAVTGEGGSGILPIRGK